MTGLKYRQLVFKRRKNYYHKNPKNSDTWKSCCNHPKILTRWLYIRKMRPKDVKGIANSVDPDQNAPSSSLIWVCTVCPDLSVRKLRIIMVHLRMLLTMLTTAWQNHQCDLCVQQRLRSACTSTQCGQSSLSAWRRFGFLATHKAHSKDWSVWPDAQADLSLNWAHMHFFFMLRRLFYCYYT